MPHASCEWETSSILHKLTLPSYPHSSIRLMERGSTQGRALWNKSNSPSAQWDLRWIIDVWITKIMAWTKVESSRIRYWQKQDMQFSEWPANAKKPNQGDKGQRLAAESQQSTRRTLRILQSQKLTPGASKGLDLYKPRGDDGLKPQRRIVKPLRGRVPVMAPGPWNSTPAPPSS